MREPVYFRAYLDLNGNVDELQFSLYHVNLSGGELMPCPLTNLRDLELRIGGNVRVNFAIDYKFIHLLR